MRFVVAALLIVLGLAAQAYAQATGPREIGFGETLRGELTSADLRHDDGTPYDAYRFKGLTGQRVLIDMKSTAFDAFVVLRKLGAGSDLASDDDGGDSHDARLAYTLPANGDYEIRANAAGSDSRGGYALSLRLGAGSVPPAAKPAR
ncbi:hypothetical protein BH11PSE2_BH11PSE2_05740 [soil metagenome]